VGVHQRKKVRNSQCGCGKLGFNSFEVVLKKGARATVFSEYERLVLIRIDVRVNRFGGSFVQVDRKDSQSRHIILLEIRYITNGARNLIW
jgi:hypothetical protein